MLDFLNAPPIYYKRFPATLTKRGILSLQIVKIDRYWMTGVKLFRCNGSCFRERCYFLTFGNIYTIEN